MSFASKSNGTATISGTPAANSAQTYDVSLTASNGYATSAHQTLVITVDPSAPPAFQSASSIYVAPGISSNFTVTATGSPAPTLTVNGPLPRGISFVDLGAGKARISGVPEANTVGTYRVTIIATNGSNSVARQDLTVTVTNPTDPKITSSSTTDLARGFSSTFTVTTSGSPTPTITATGQLPPGVTYTDNGDGTATISGTPSVTSNGTYLWYLTAQNGYGQAARQTLHLTVNAPGIARITSASTAVFKSGVASSFSLTAAGSPSPTFTIVGNLPSGLTFKNLGGGQATITGTPEVGLVGSYAVTVSATNGYGAPATQRLTVEVGQAKAPSFTSSASTSLQIGTNSTFSITASGSPTPSVTVSGNLPAGLKIVTGSGSATITGTPGRGTEGSYNLAITATNGYGNPARETFRLVVTPGYVDGYWYATFRAELVFRGHASAIAPKTPQRPRAITAMAKTPDNGGYWLVARFGGVFPFGDAHFYGSIARLHLRSATVAFAPTPDGHGYWIVTSRGNVFTFGDARFYGSGAGRRIAPVVSFARTPDGRGYWLVTAKGQVLHFGNAGYYGSPAGSSIPKVVAITGTPDGHGYWIVTNRGTLFTYGDAGNYGSPAPRRIPPVTAFAPTADGHGYWIVTTRGNVFNYGDARFYGSSAHTHLNGGVRAFVPNG